MAVAVKLSRLHAPLSLHYIGENVINTGQMTAAFTFEPFQYLRIEPYANRYFGRRQIALADHASQLFLGQCRDIRVVDMRIIACRLPGGQTLNNRLLPFSEWLAENIGGVPVY